jgi:hypothetical protein
MGCSYFLIKHKTGEGILSYHSKGRHSNEHKRVLLNNPELIEAEVETLRKSLRLNDEAELLMMISIATDEMIRLVTMHPEVWFMDVTHGTNRQRRDLFMLAIRTPTGETFPGNITIIPSQKRWIFHCIYRYAFIHLYGTDTCSRNRLVLCDEDESEYGPFENQILTNKTFKDSRLMLCIFHALTQPFKKEVFPLLPKKSPKSTILSDVGKNYGEGLFGVSISVYYVCMLNARVNSHNRGCMQDCMLNGRVNSHNPGCMLVIVSLPTNSHGRVNSHNQGCTPQLCHFLLTFINQYLSRKFLFLINDASMQCIHY